MASCAAIVPAYRSEATIARALESLVGQGAALSRILAVCSDRPSADAARSIAGVEVVELGKRVTAGRARNIGRQCAGEVSLLLFVDADCVLPAGAVTELAQELESCGLAILAAAVRPSDSRPVSWVRHLLEFKDFEPGGARRWPDLVPSAALLCRSEWFDTAGGFPDLWPGEDFVFCRRVAARGGRVACSRRVAATHFHECRWTELLAHQFRLGRTSAMARRMSGLPGYALAERPWSAALLGAGRLGRCALWVARRQPRSAVRGILWSPVIAALLASWAAGFAAGGRAGLEIAR